MTGAITVSATEPTSVSLVEIVTTVSSEAEAVALARELVEQGVVACASFFPVRSIYPWKGDVCDEQEFQLVLKTLSERADTAERLLVSRHPYETPAVYRLRLERPGEDYAAWVKECVRGSGPGKA
jgi:periplasmic divalent cation tolerance protein